MHPGRPSSGPRSLRGCVEERGRREGCQGASRGRVPWAGQAGSIPGRGRAYKSPRQRQHKGERDRCGVAMRLGSKWGGGGGITGLCGPLRNRKKANQGEGRKTFQGNQQGSRCVVGCVQGLIKYKNVARNMLLGMCLHPVFKSLKREREPEWERDEEAWNKKYGEVLHIT